MNNGLTVDYADVAAKVGVERAREWYHAYDEAVDTVERLVREEGIDCDFMLARVIEGARYTLGIAFVSTLLASGTGTVLALLAAASGRWIDAVLSRGLDTLTAIPSKMFALLLVAGFGSSIPMLVVAAAVIYVPGAFRIARSLAVNINALDYVTVARTRGEGTAYIMARRGWKSTCATVSWSPGHYAETRVGH